MRDRKALIALLLLSVAVALAVVYYFFDPVEVRWMPRCIWKVATGADCPGCGSQRMAHALMHGDIVEAWHANAFALCMLPLIIFLLWLEFNRERHPRLYQKVHSQMYIWIIAVAVLVWWVVRNLV